jgi:3-oxoacyl-[acyl-carrier protein] reductase
MTGRLEGKVAIVTGAGSGIGRAITAAFLREGAIIIGVDRDPAGLEGTAQVAGRANLIPVVADVTDEALPVRLEDLLRQHRLALDILVNNAGVGRGSDVEGTSDADLRQVLEINLVGLFRLSRFAVAQMKPRRQGTILNLASVYAVMGAQISSAYSASKGAVAALTRQMATDYGPSGIRVNALAPGLIATPLTEDRIRTQAWRRQICIDQTPLRRVGLPEDVAAAAVFLCSGEASFITGEVLKVDGGWTMSGFPRESDA